MATRRLIFVLILVLSACQPTDTVDAHHVNFEEVNWYASRAAMAYQPESHIKQAFPDTQLVATTRHGRVQYFLEQDTAHSRQIISIRGTDNLANIREDAEYVESRNPKLAIFVHSGFDEDAIQVFNELMPHLDPNKEVVVTGHSLGAAIATLMMMYLHEEGFTVGPSINFGQPKVTNRAGAKKYAFLPLIRVADEDDLVPMVPPDDLIDDIHGGYEHLGPEVMLLEGQYYVYQTHRQVERDKVDAFWSNLGDESVPAHFMKHYLHNIQSKLSQAQAVPYDQRERYLSH